MDSLKQKIKNTALFSDEDKIAILAAMDGYEASDIARLEAVIDEFDKAHTKAVADYKKAVYDTLDAIAAKQQSADAPRVQAAASQMKQGIDELLQA